MSIVTGILIAYANGEKESIGQAIRDWCASALINRGRDSLPPVRLDEEMCTGKHPQMTVFGGGYNMFPEDEFETFFLGLPWESPENAVLVMQPEDGPTKIVRPAYRRD